MKGIILIVDDEKNQREIVAGFLQKKGHEVLTAPSGEKAAEMFDKGTFDVIITDFKMKGLDGVELLKAVKSANPMVKVILVSAFGTVQTAVQAMKEGAEDFLVKPINLDRLDQLVNRALEHNALVRENRDLKNMLAERFSFEGIIGKSGAMQHALNTAGRAAKSEATILIRGESGTGKGLFANAVHLASPRAGGPFRQINCAALAPGVLESELFGHVKGAFTGADKNRVGLLESANKGTLFIDEVGDIPLEIQTKLLNVIQSREFTRVGGNEVLKTDVRIVAATHRDIEEMISEGAFREDLYFRLNVVSVPIPPLRDRKSDIPDLVEHFLKVYTERNNKIVTGVSKEGMDHLMKYGWPGNVRELENAIEQAVVLCRDDVIQTGDLPSPIRDFGGKADKAGDIQLGSTPLPKMVETLEKAAIIQALEQTGGVQTKAADLLGIGERNLRYKMEKYGIRHEK